MQLYDLAADNGETKNLIAEYSDKATELKTALKKIILDGRSTPGATQKNEVMEDRKQIEPIID